MFLKRIEIRNFRQFEHLTLSCKQRNILVGPNNAGKSTTLDALRIVADVLRYAKSRNPQVATNEAGEVCAFHSLPLSYFSVAIENAPRNFSDDDAVVEVTHENGSRLAVHLHPERSARAYLKTVGATPRSARKFLDAFPASIVIVPTLGPFDASETYVSDETAERNKYTRLASRNFRNILMRLPDSEFTKLQDVVRETWQGAAISRPRVTDHMTKSLYMEFQEARMPREVQWAGFGFQVWLQMMFQVSRASQDSILVLDEPDIYLHPDQQRKLVRRIVGGFGQLFLATHSSEIINEVEQSDIVVISRTRKSAKRVSDDDDYRSALAYIGSSENAEFARLARSKRIVFVEGHDKRLLKRFAQKLGDLEPLLSDDLLYFPLGGFSQWRKAGSVAWALRSLFGIEAKIATVLDRDYFCDEYLEGVKAELSSENMHAWVHARKEIENYMLIEPAIVRLVERRAEDRGRVASPSRVQDILLELLEGMKEDCKIRSQVEYTSYYKRNKSELSEVSLITRARNDFDARWIAPGGQYALVPGKEFLSVLNTRLREEWGISITASQILSEAHKNELPLELKTMLSEISGFIQ